MPSLNKVIYRAFEYTQNHKFLWFFGIFASGSAFFSLYKIFDFNFKGYITNTDPHAQYLYAHPGYLVLGIAGFVVLYLFLSGVTVFAKNAIIAAVLKYERRQKTSGKDAIIVASKNFKKTYFTTVSLNILLFFISAWLFLPGAYVYSQGFAFRGIALLGIGSIIFVPVFIIFSLMIVFANCFILAFGMKIKDAIASGFDLLAQHWTYALTLMCVLWLLYLLLFFATASLLGFIGILAYLLSVLVKSIVLPVLISFKILYIVLIGIVLVFVNTFLNTYTSIAWVMLFLDIVRSVPSAKIKKTHEEPIESVT